MIGNDLIAWSAVSARSEDRWRSYAARILGPNEFSQWSESKLAPTMVMAWWAAKECAYKSWRAGGGDRLFQPRSFVVKKLIWKANKGDFQVEKEGKIWKGQVENNPDHLLALAWKEKRENSIFSQTGFCVAPDSTPSVSMRRFLLKALASRYSLDTEALNCRKNKWGVPEIWCKGQALPIDLSFTHHGPYWSYAYVYRPRS